MTAPRVYLAGGSSERLTVAVPWIARLREAGIVVTHDWTATEDWDHPTRNPSDPGDSTGLPDDRRAHHAGVDLEAVRAATIVWCLWPEVRSEGVAVELGAALILGRRVLISGLHRRRSIFSSLAELHETHERAFDAIRCAAWSSSVAARACAGAGRCHGCLTCRQNGGG